MPDSFRTRSELVTDFADNTAGAISEQDLRNFLLSTIVRTTNEPAAASGYIPFPLYTSLTALDINNMLSTSNLVMIPPGRHTLEGPIIPNSNQTLIMADGAILIVPPNTAYPAIQIGSTSYSSTGGVNNVNLYLNSGKIFNQLTNESGNIVDRNCITINRSNNINIYGGELVGGIHCLLAHRASGIVLEGVKTYESKSTGTGFYFSAVSGLQMNDCVAEQHGGDGCRFIAGNTNIRVWGGRYCDNGSYLHPGNYIGVGLHCGQSSNVIIGGNAKFTGNIGNGLEWKSSLPPSDIWLDGITYQGPHGMNDFFVSGVLCQNNWGNQLEVRWNYSTSGTLQPENVTIIRASIHGAKSYSNGMYIDASGISVDYSVIGDCEGVGLAFVEHSGQLANNTYFLNNGFNYAYYGRV